jgi:protein-disulfide isomerase
VRQNGSAELYAIASELGLSAFGPCYSSGKHDADLKQGTDECTESGIYGTPTFFVNGKPYVGPGSVMDAGKEVKRLLGE